MRRRRSSKEQQKLVNVLGQKMMAVILTNSPSRNGFAIVLDAEQSRTRRCYTLRTLWDITKQVIDLYDCYGIHGDTGGGSSGSAWGVQAGGNSHPAPAPKPAAAPPAAAPAKKQ